MNKEYIILLIWNITVMLFYGADKSFARKGKMRLSEKSLIIPAFLLGGAGAIFGMVLFNHKTSKIKFRLLIPLAVTLNAFILIFYM